MTGADVIRGRGVTLRRATLDDLPRFAAIINSPEVARWWGIPSDADKLRDDLWGPDVTTYAIESGGSIAGLIQYHEENEPDYRSAGIDLALAPEWHGRGLGSDAVRALAGHLFAERGHHRLTIDPAADNARAI